MFWRRCSGLQVTTQKNLNTSDRMTRCTMRAFDNINGTYEGVGQHKPEARIAMNTGFYNLRQ